MHRLPPGHINEAEFFKRSTINENVLFRNFPVFTQRAIDSMLYTAARNQQKRTLKGDTAAAQHFTYVIDPENRENNLPFKYKDCWVNILAD